jgi:hypothetical protein
MQPHVTLDYYDDESGTVIKKVMDGREIPDFIKEASYAGDGVDIPDHEYALVMSDGEHKLRKFACVDKGNTALSAIYFLENRDKLPAHMQKEAAANIVRACVSFGLEVPTKLAESMTDVDGFSIGSTIYKKASASNYALSGMIKTAGRFPIDSYGDIVKAAEWFDAYSDSLHPAERREYCLNVEQRADELGIPVSVRLHKYASLSYAPDYETEIAVEARKQLWRDGTSERSLLDSLLEKKASVHPDVFCEALRQFDEGNGMDIYWDREIPDPWLSTYGYEKTAEWEFSTQGERITASQLKELAVASRKLLEMKFGADMADSFAKSPVDIFESMPLDSKKIIMRMANDPQPSPTLA